MLKNCLNVKELEHVWKGWRDRIKHGKVREKYIRFVELSNEAARLNGNANKMFKYI